MTYYIQIKDIVVYFETYDEAVSFLEFMTEHGKEKDYSTDDFREVPLKKISLVIKREDPTE